MCTSVCCPCTFSGTDPCKPSPCQYSGVCMPDIGANGYTCVCSVPYSGQDCSQGNNDEDDDGGDDDEEEEDDNDDYDDEFFPVKYSGQTFYTNMFRGSHRCPLVFVVVVVVVVVVAVVDLPEGEGEVGLHNIFCVRTQAAVNGCKHHRRQSVQFQTQSF